MMMQSRAIIVAGLLMTVISGPRRAWPTFLVIRGGALKSPVTIWHKPIAVTHYRETTLSLLYEAAYTTDEPCTLSANGARYEVAEYWYGRDATGPVGTEPPADLTYNPLKRAAVIDVQNDNYCWVRVEPGTDVVGAGKTGILVPSYATGVLRDAGIR